MTSPGSFYSFNGIAGQNPQLTLERGKTYTFQVNTDGSSHPFRINSPGVVNNNISSGTITYTVPTAAMNYTYDLFGAWFWQQHHHRFSAHSPTDRSDPKPVRRCKPDSQVNRHQWLERHSQSSAPT